MGAGNDQAATDHGDDSIPLVVDRKRAGQHIRGIFNYEEENNIFNLLGEGKGKVEVSPFKNAEKYSVWPNSTP